MRLMHDLGTSLTLQTPTGATVWSYVYGGKPKPFFHPLCTPSGINLTNFEPWDHVWHRGLWYTIKFINGENFWEERPPFGTQQTLLPPAVTCDANGSISWISEQRWVRPGHTATDAGGSVFNEIRRLKYVPLDADSYAIDWDITLDPQADLLLDRTPFTTWGGYGGLTFRGDRSWTPSSRLLFSDGQTSERPLGLRASWCDLSGNLDGGDKLTGGVALFDHPANVRHPTPFYGGTGSGHYFNAAFLFHEPMNVKKGEVLRFRYRILVHNHIWEKPQLDGAYQQWIG